MEPREFSDPKGKYKFRAEQESYASEGHPERNEDAVLFDEENSIFGIFDGMGGPPCGDIASGRAKDFIREALEGLPEGATPKETMEALESALLRANQDIVDEINKNPKKYINAYGGMGTTASVVKIWEGSHNERKAIIGNVGDSRVYIQHQNGSMEQATLDDSILRETSSDEDKLKNLQKEFSNATSKTDIDPKDRGLFDRRNELTQYLGRKKGIRPRMYIVDIEESDKVIIVSDGVSDNLTDVEMESILTKAFTDGENGSMALANAAQKRSNENHFRAKEDDMSAIVLEFSKSEPAAKLPEGGEDTYKKIAGLPPAVSGTEEDKRDLAEAEGMFLNYPAVETMLENEIQEEIDDSLKKFITCECGEEYMITPDAGACFGCGKIGPEKKRLDALKAEQEKRKKPEGLADKNSDVDAMSEEGKKDGTEDEEEKIIESKVAFEKLLQRLKWKITISDEVFDYLLNKSYFNIKRARVAGWFSKTLAITGKTATGTDGDERHFTEEEFSAYILQIEQTLQEEDEDEERGAKAGEVASEQLITGEMAGETPPDKEADTDEEDSEDEEEPTDEDSEEDKKKKKKAKEAREEEKKEEKRREKAEKAWGEEKEEAKENKEYEEKEATEWEEKDKWGKAASLWFKGLRGGAQWREGDKAHQKAAKIGKAWSWFVLGAGYLLFHIATTVAEKGDHYTAKDFWNSVDEVYGVNIGKNLTADEK